jgi:urate oxidase
MSVVLGENRYGKSRVRLLKVTREENAHRVTEWNVEVWLEGKFSECFQHGDNSRILPTDTMKNTVYSLARSSNAVSMESFAQELVSHFIDTNPNADKAGARIVATGWKHLAAGEKQFATAFTHHGEKHDTAVMTLSSTGDYASSSGFEDLWLLKTAHSSFAGYLKDRLTTLKETDDRLFGTLAKAQWKYNSTGLDFNASRLRTEAALIEAFAVHHSLSVQQTLYAMAKGALEAVSELAEVHLSMPNKHCNLVDLAPFGQDNPNQIFVPTDEPHGSIEASVRRTN